MKTYSFDAGWRSAVPPGGGGKQEGEGAEEVPRASLPPELLVVQKHHQTLGVNKLQPHVLLLSKGGSKLYTPPAMRAAPQLVPPLVHGPFYAGQRDGSPSSSRGSSPRPRSPHFSPVPPDRYSSPGRSRAKSLDQNPKLFSADQMADSISHSRQGLRGRSPRASPPPDTAKRADSPGEPSAALLSNTGDPPLSLRLKFLGLLRGAE